MEKNKAFIDSLHKMERYCDYQERCLKDVEDKLFKIEVPVDFHQEIKMKLVENNNFNNLRYAKAFASGKFRYKKWGRKKIFYALRLKRVSDKDIFSALLEIDEDEYSKTLKELIDFKVSKIGNIDDDFSKKKVLNFAIQKGYESNLIWEIINQIH